jgi:uncharacterized protein YecE (DUF72 family)
MLRSWERLAWARRRGQTVPCWSRVGTRRRRTPRTRDCGFYARQFDLVEVDATYYALPAEQTGKDGVYLKDVDPAVADQAWERFLAALDPVRQAGKLGAILLQFPPWFPISRRRKEYIVSCAQRVAPDRVCVEFRNHT